MKTHLVGDDCKPLLIKAGEDVTVPLVTLEQQKKEEEEKLKWVHFKIYLVKNMYIQLFICCIWYSRLKKENVLKGSLDSIPSPSP